MRAPSSDVEAVRFAEPTGLAEGFGQEASDALRALAARFTPCHADDGPRRRDAGHPYGMGSPASPLAEAASSAMDWLVSPWRHARPAGPDATPTRSNTLVEACPSRLLAQR